MLRGVNKRIIEVLHPEDEYFEKIVFYISPKTGADSSLLSRKTSEYVEQLSTEVKDPKRKWIFAGSLIAAALGGAGTMFLILM